MTDARQKSDRQNAKVDEKILRVIHELRTEHQACTLRNLASQMRISETAVRNRMNRMRGEFLDWNKMPGSVHLLVAGMERIGLSPVPTPDPEEQAPPTGGLSLAGYSPEAQAQIQAAVKLAAVEMLAEMEQRILYGLNAGATTTTADPEAGEDHATPTSPEGSPAGTPDTDQDQAPASPSAS